MAGFVVANKVAIITGGASGIGFQCAVKLLEKGAKGVAIVDIVPENGKSAAEQLQNKYGKDKVIFVKTDVTNYDEFDRAFKDTVGEFGNIDILINGAGILNDREWQKEVALNVNGVIHGMLLGLEIYIPKYKSGPEGLIVNMSSIVGIGPGVVFPIYTGTKFAVHGMTLAWGSPGHFERTKVRVVGVCPGFTNTPLMELQGKCLNPTYDSMLNNGLQHSVVDALQPPELVALHMMKVIEKAPNGTMWVIEGGEAAYQYKMISRHDIEKSYL